MSTLSGEPDGGGQEDLHQLDLNLHPNEASGLLAIENEPLLESHDWEYGFWVVMDEDEAEDCVGAVGHKRGAGIEEGWEIDRLHAEPHFIFTEGETEDAESVARHDGWVYVFGSQHGGKRGPVDPEEAWVARFREEDVSHAFADPAVKMEIARTELVLHRVINDALKEFGPGLLPQGTATHEAFVTRSREEEGLAELVHEDDVTINIEGAAFRDDGSLLVGLRYPLEAEGRPLLVDVAGIGRLFEADGGQPEVTGFTWVAAVGREGTVAGVRDLEIVGDELHLVTGNIDSKQKGSVVLEDHPGPGYGGDPLRLQAAGARKHGSSGSRVRPRVPEPTPGGGNSFYRRRQLLLRYRRGRGCPPASHPAAGVVNEVHRQSCRTLKEEIFGG